MGPLRPGAGGAGGHLRSLDRDVCSGDLGVGTMVEETEPFWTGLRVACSLGRDCEGI